MDNLHHDSSDKESSERRNSNTEWLPTKCRITKPPPPKPATNPLQFIKVAPCPLFQKAQEQIKKVEEIKIMRQDIKDEAEDWQLNLDNWKSSRRKRQEHIIERVVEVKKLEQEEQGRGRRKSKTFSEMLEERNKRGHRLNIPIYDDDSNDLSDYGIGSSSSKTNSIKDVDTDDSSSFLDDKDHISDSQSAKDASSASNQSQSEDELNTTTNLVDKENNVLDSKMNQISNNNYSSKLITSSVSNSSISKNNYTSNLYTNFSNKQNVTTKTSNSKTSILDTNLQSNNQDLKLEQPQYTYEGAIQDYRSRIRSKINIDESIFNKQQDYLKGKETTETQKAVPKVDVYKRKEIFEVEKPLEIHHFESNTSRRLSEDFVNTQSIKERLKSLEKCTDQPLKSIEKNTSQIGSVKSRIKSLNKQNEVDNKNNNVQLVNNNSKNAKERSSVVNSAKTISSYLLDKSSSNLSTEQYKSAKTKSEWQAKDEISERCSSPEAEIFMNKLNMFNRDLDAYLGKSSHLQNGLEDYSNSSVELAGLSSDREDSGIHTADVSCSVSQADEPVEDTDLSSTTIPSCIEKLNKEKEKELIRNTTDEEKTEKLNEMERVKNEIITQDKDKTSEEKVTNVHPETNYKDLRKATEDFLSAVRQEADNDFASQKQQMISPVSKPNKSETDGLSFDINKQQQKSAPTLDKKEEVKTDKSVIENNNTYKIFDTPKEKPIIYENVEIRSFNTMVDGVFDNSSFLAPPKSIEPPKEKPPPPPPPDDDEEENSEKTKQANVKRLNSTKRIKKEIHIKRSSFLGLDEPTDDQLDPEVPIDRPPDINTFLQKESQLEKSLYKKLQGSRDVCLSEVESQDSGLESERGRLSSDTWCSSFGDSSTPTHGRQDSEQTNSVTSEEDEITKKEREIIEMVEKEEKSRDINDYSSPVNGTSPSSGCCNMVHQPCKNVNNEQFNRSYIHQQNSGYKGNLDDQDSEVLKVEHELLQLEREELERQRESIVFRESRAKIYHQNNRHSLENICDTVDMFPQYPEAVNYRKSMPELPNELRANDYHKSVTDVPYYYKSIPDVDVQYRKSMPDIQQAYLRSVPDYRKSASDVHNDMRLPVEHRKSMPELQQDVQISAFRSPPPLNRQPIMPGKPLRPLIKEQREKERFMMLNQVESDNIHYQNTKPTRPITRPGLHALSAVPKSRHIPNDNWIQPKANAETKNKSYNQHWLYQEAELRRLADQKNGSPKRNWQPTRQEKHIPEPIIQTLTQRVQNRAIHTERNQSTTRRSENSPNKEYTQHPYLGHPHTLGHASPVAYPPPAALEDSQGKMLSVSGKKKCSYCGNELGRGAAMIIESLCLFYHMECFKCCVCHTQLGDGLMGTDVRVRNQKLHCHNCYSSDDGVKFSCV
ncbi:hypothetical protein ILUMI_00783 [Ignelater luminosus]|uniref:LIM zinc-binding domain-containing protein n=1 Tax=Ignelater luminosus TaxID=2038154 RepID=A0A8K0DGK5_IGNLU|nr:hypothetical protein ILUMI_00783 [Ignelater luminosus]